MAWRSRKPRRMREPIPGWLEITGWTEPNPGGSQTWQISGTILASGILPTSAILRTDRPGPWGNRLPVTVDRANPLNFVVDWERFREAPRKPRELPAAEAPRTGHHEPAIAVVTAVYEVQGSAAGTAAAGMVDLVLDVARTDGRQQRSGARISFSSPGRRSVVARVGTQLPVLVDPEAPQYVLVDLSRLPAAEHQQR